MKILWALMPSQAYHQGFSVPPSSAAFLFLLCATHLSGLHDPSPKYPSPGIFFGELHNDSGCAGDTKNCPQGEMHSAVHSSRQTSRLLLNMVSTQQSYNGILTHLHSLHQCPLSVSDLPFVEENQTVFFSEKMVCTSTACSFLSPTSQEVGRGAAPPAHLQCPIQD